MHAHSVTLVMSDSLGPIELWPTRLLWPWGSPGGNTRVDCHALLQGIFSAQRCVSCISCITGRSFTAELLVKTWIIINIHIYIYIIIKHISKYIKVLVIQSNYEIVEPEMQRKLRILLVKDHMISFLWGV